MSESKNDLMELVMELVYEADANTLSVKWSDELSVESARFSQTIVSLFATIQEKQVANLIVSSGRPAGGVLTDDIIAHFIQNIPGTSLEHIAILESPDYLWDANLCQVIRLLIVNYHLPIAIEVVRDEATARKWFYQLSAAEKAKSGIA